MALIRYKIGECVELFSEKCGIPDLTAWDISGVNSDKEFFEPSKQTGEDTSNYKNVPPNYFACNLMHVGRDVVLPVGLNHTVKTKIVSPAYTIFKIKDEIPLLREYFYMMLKSEERDRYFWFHTDASVRDGMSWGDFCDLEIDLPPLPIQQKYVDVYNAMLANQQSYERGLEDLKLVCDAYIDNLRKKLPHRKLGNYISICENRNDDLVYGMDAVRGISIEKKFIETKANMEGVSLKPYAIVNPDEFAYVTVTSRNGEKLSIARNSSNEVYLCSSSYIVFKVDDTGKLLPEYLSMLFERGEFNRYSRFHSWGKEYHGRYCESEYEYAFTEFLEAEGWIYSSGSNLSRVTKRDVLIADDFKKFLADTNPYLTEEEVTQIFDTVRLVGGESDFAALHKVYGWMVDGIPFTPQDGLARMIPLIHFENPHKNIFRVVNQFTVEYTNNGQKETRRPDVLLFVNGMPVCIMELKNPADVNATVYDAWEQIAVRYWRDIPHLLHYCPLACISDGVKTRLGTVRTAYEHFYAWRRVNDEDAVSTLPFEETETMIKGVYAPERFLEIFRDYIYFQDSIYDSSEVEIVCRYPQFFAARLLKQSIVNSVTIKSGKGGTYFGATGCGKTYTMAFLARQLALRCTDIPEIGSPTIILIVDRDELQKQGARLFTKSTEFLNLGEVSVVKNRAQLREELGARQSGGFYICTIQKFCDREDDKIGLINDRQNIICFSDEAHRTQLEHSKKIRFSKDADENMKAMISKPYAKVLKEAFPRAVFVGFTGTPIAETYQTFGDEIDRYTMDQAVADGLTVSIKYHPRIAKVLLDKTKVKEIEAYYKKCADDGATYEDIEASKKAMSSMEVILGEPSRLERLATDIHDHYLSSCAGDPDRIQKAMLVCSNRKIAYALLQKFREKYPEWFEERKSPDGVSVTEEELKELKPMPFLAMVASVGSNDEKEMYNYLGGVKNDKRSEELDAAFKQEKSNFHIVIVVDMWITGFDVPCLTYLYNDKPLKKHMLIQTISRVNRKYPGKEFGMVIDYIGIRNNMREAMKMYGGDSSVAPTSDDVLQATSAFREELEILKTLFADYDLSPFLNPDCAPGLRYRLLAKAAEYVFVSTQELQTGENKGSKKVSFKTYFLKTVKRMRTAFDICQPSGDLGEEESALAQCFMAIAGFVRKMSGTSEVDTDTMNRAVSRMVEEALKYNQVESVLESGEEEDIFSPEYFEKLSDVEMPATKLELLVKMLRKQIKEYGKVNQLAAKTFEEMLEKTIAEYHERRSHLTAEEAGEAQEQASEDIIKIATEQALAILRQMNENMESFRKVGLTFEEKAFYDILIALRDQYNFEYGTDKETGGVVINDKCRSLAKKVKEIIDVKSSFTDWLNNQNIRNQLKLEIKLCLIKNGYPPQYSPEVFSKVMEQVENFEEHEEHKLISYYDHKPQPMMKVAEKAEDYGKE